MSLESLSNNIQTSISLDNSWPSGDLHIEKGYEIAIGIGSLIGVIVIVYALGKLKDYFHHKAGL